MAKTYRSTRRVRKTRKHRGGVCVEKVLNEPLPRLKHSNTCGPGKQTQFSDLYKGLKVKIVGEMDTVVVSSPRNNVIQKIGKNAAEAAISEKLKKANEYVFEVVNVVENNINRTVEFKVVAFPESNTRGKRTGKNHVCSNSNDEFDKELCYGFKLIGPKGDLLYDKFSFYRMN